MMTVGVIASEVSRVERQGQIDGKIPAGSKKTHVNLGQNILIAATTSSAEGKGTQEDTIRCLPERPMPHIPLPRSRLGQMYHFWGTLSRLSGR